MKSPRPFGALAIMVCLQILSAGCCCHRETYGSIYVSQPQVFTRERLVIAREKEIQFLNSVLNAPVQSTIHGSRDIRTLSAFENSLAMTVSPSSVATTVTNATLGEVTDLSNHQLASPGTQELSKNATVSSVDHFNDVLAYRDSVNAVIREKELDDAHDRHGRTLYTLKFDTTVVPGANTIRPAFVRIHIRDPEQTDDEEARKLFNAWLARVNTRLSDDENGIVTRIDRAQLGPDDAELVYSWLGAGKKEFIDTVNSMSFPQANQDEWIANMNRAALSTLRFFSENPDNRRLKLQDILANPNDRIDLIVGMQVSLHAKYEHDFKHLVSYQYNFDPIGATNTAVSGYLAEYHPKSNEESVSGSDLFFETLHSWDQNAYVDSIEPHVYAQNISDVSSKTKLIDAAFAISAILGKFGTLADNARILNESQTLLQAIKRQPLAVSYSKGAEFGWLLGPAFATKHGRAVFVQTPGRQSFAVSIVVPVWMQKLQLYGDAAWLDGDANLVLSKAVEFQPIELPSDMDAITTALQEGLFSRLPKPTLYAGQLVLESDSKQEQTLLILGRELWRNPEVFVESTKADSVDLLPDMKGLLAHFQSFPRTYSSHADLTVVTTFGSASLDGAVTILAPPKAQFQEPKAKLVGKFAVAGVTPLTFALNTNTMPSGYAGFSIKLSTTSKPGEWTKIDENAAKLSPDGGTLSVMITPPEPKPTAPVFYTVDLGIRLKPLKLPSSLLGTQNSPQNTFVYFPAKDQDKPRITLPSPPVINYKNGTPDVSSIVLKPIDPVKIVDLYKAYLGLEESLTNERAVISLKADGGTAKTFLIKADTDGWLVKVPLNVDDLPPDSYDSIEIQFQTPDGEASKLTVLGGPISVKKQ